MSAKEKNSQPTRNGKYLTLFEGEEP